MLSYRFDLLLQFPRSLKIKPNSSPYTQDYPSTLLFDTQEKSLAYKSSEMLLTESLATMNMLQICALKQARKLIIKIDQRRQR